LPARIAVNNRKTRKKNERCGIADQRLQFLLFLLLILSIAFD
jgi:hypothetical protein